MRNKVFSNFLLVLLTHAFVTKATAGFFGPTTFEDCVTDLLKNGNNTPYNVAHRVCRDKHPKLLVTARGRDSSLVCRDKDDRSVYQIAIKQAGVSVKNLSSVSFTTTYRTREVITFKGDSTQKATQRRVGIFGEINLVDGDGNIIVEFRDGKSGNFQYNFVCDEQALTSK